MYPATNTHAPRNEYTWHSRRIQIRTSDLDMLSERPKSESELCLLRVQGAYKGAHKGAYKGAYKGRVRGARGSARRRVFGARTRGAYKGRV